MYKLIDIVLLFSLSLQCVSCDKPLIRQTANGPVEGIEQTTSLGQKYYAFKGVPFAETPITGKDPYTGEQVDRRFKAPEPLKRNWTDILKVHSFADSCLVSTHLLLTKAKQTENCLYLNIFVPDGGVEKKTVLVWLFGGGFTEGDCTDTYYGPDFLLLEDNIVVTIQYRVGMFGFLNLGTDEYSGNMGLKDQQLALKWIHENIENFSGNKNEILLFGESAGLSTSLNINQMVVSNWAHFADVSLILNKDQKCESGGASVSYQMLNVESRKYFNRAAIMGGSVFGYLSLTKANHLSRMQECSNLTETNEMIEYLKSTDSDIILKCYLDIDWGRTLKPSWTGTIERPSAKNAFITQSPDEIYNSEKAPVIDALFSICSQEGVAFDPSLTKSTEPLIKSDWDKPMLRLPFDGFDENTHLNEYKKALESLMIYYSHATDITAIRKANIDLMSAINFVDSVLKNFVLQTKTNNKDRSRNKNTFLFRFGVHTELNLNNFKPNMDFDGAAHGDDLGYIFHCHVLDQFETYDTHLKGKKSVAYNTIERMVKILTNFARTGDPTVEGDTPFKPSISVSEIFCQEIDNNPKSSLTTNILEQLHYDTWREVEQICQSVGD